MAVAATLVLQFALSKSSSRDVRDPSAPSSSSRGVTAAPASAPKQSLHVIRRLQHAATGCIFVYASENLLDPTQTSLTLLSCSLLFYGIHRLRLALPQLNDFLVKHYASLLRPDEAAGKLPGAFFFLAGSTLCSVAYEKHIFHLAVLLLSFGDPCAGLVGTLYKHRAAYEHRAGPEGRGLVAAQGKTAVGSLACFVACFATTFVVEHWSCHADNKRTALVTALYGACVGSVAERADLLLRVDDNLAMPVIAGALLTAIERASPGTFCL